RSLGLDASAICDLRKVDCVDADAGGTVTRTVASSVGRYGAARGWDAANIARAAAIMGLGIGRRFGSDGRRMRCGTGEKPAPESLSSSEAAGSRRRDVAPVMRGCRIGEDRVVGFVVVLDARGVEVRIDRTERTTCAESDQGDVDDVIAEAPAIRPA